MPLANIKVIEGVFSDAEKRQMIEKVTDAMVAVVGEHIRDKTVVIVEETRSGDWGVGGGKHAAASSIFRELEESITDPLLRERLVWVRKVATPGAQAVTETPFTAEQLPEAIGTLLTLNYVNRFSHVVMDGSPVGNPFKNASLRLFGYELRETTERPITPGRGLDLLPPTRRARGSSPLPRARIGFVNRDGCFESCVIQAEG